ncbi:mitochondrial import inner membrane translocase subunit TIM23-2 [Amborella trichopoda]|uniref:Uncharacterized protein n=1 Tax=Amborella trichopoda TaxID=13333 RepID=W1PIQ8_AMBTC|nr:mitochondrial import inner membrane translocase subunit TIM23-2 [Amborella trichopoda]ERN07521.1 hypothetical protein AMTR_s00154p00035690 [Amborella trichopoda]|eukprot:XP_006845846.1 mitochondrial import inner membrane translocase subunit TIM23-2 [Amborella trichopoda]
MKELIYCASNATDIHEIQWKDIVKFYTGCGLFGGAITGGVKDLIEVLRDIEDGDTLKLRANRVLNTSHLTREMYACKFIAKGMICTSLKIDITEFKHTDHISNGSFAGFWTRILYNVKSRPEATASARVIGGLAGGLGKKYIAS